MAEPSAIQGATTYPAASFNRNPKEKQKTDGWEIAVKTAKIIRDVAFVIGPLLWPFLFAGCASDDPSDSETNPPHVPPPPRDGYLIVTREMFADQLAPLAASKISKGFNAEIVTLEWIMDPGNLIEGRDPQEKIRNYIIEQYQENNLRWVLLAGDADGDENPGASDIPIPTVLDKAWEIPARYVHQPDPCCGYYYFPADYYYSALEGTWDENGDGDCESSEILDLYPNVYVGRLPAQTQAEMADMADKILNYSPVPAQSFLSVGAIMEPIPGSMDQSVLSEYIIANCVPADVDVTTLYSKDGNLNRTIFNDELNYGGHTLVNTTGHGSTQYLFAEGTDYFNFTDVYVLNNSVPVLWYSNACNNNQFDMYAPNNSISEQLVKLADHGAIAFIGSARVGVLGRMPDNDIGEYSSAHNVLFWKHFFSGSHRPGEALYQANLEYSNIFGLTGVSERGNKFLLLTIMLLGDPELTIIGE